MLSLIIWLVPTLQILTKLILFLNEQPRERWPVIVHIVWSAIRIVVEFVILIIIIGLMISTSKYNKRRNYDDDYDYETIDSSKPYKPNTNDFQRGGDYTFLFSLTQQFQEFIDNDKYLPNISHLIWMKGLSLAIYKHPLLFMYVWVRMLSSERVVPKVRLQEQDLIRLRTIEINPTITDSIIFLGSGWQGQPDGWLER